MNVRTWARTSDVRRHVTSTVTDIHESFHHVSHIGVQLLQVVQLLQAGPVRETCRGRLIHTETPTDPGTCPFPPDPHTAVHGASAWSDPVGEL